MRRTRTVAAAVSLNLVLALGMSVGSGLLGRVVNECGSPGVSFP